jgi:hypothetical protein
MFGVVTLFGDAYAFELMNLEDDSAQSITASNAYNGTLPASQMLVTCEDETAHFTEHGTAPTAKSGTDVGSPITAGQSYVVSGINNILRFQIINAVAGSDAVIKLIFYTRG